MYKNESFATNFLNGSSREIQHFDGERNKQRLLTLAWIVLH